MTADAELDTKWMDRGACLGKDTAIFERPANGGGRNSYAPERWADAAKAICAGCQVRAECLAWAYAMNDQYMVLGGTTPRDRIGHKRRNRRVMQTVSVGRVVEVRNTEGNVYVFPTRGTT